MPAQTKTSSTTGAKGARGRVTEPGRRSVGRVVDASESLLNRVADLQTRTAHASRNDWVAAIVQAQANYTRDVTKASTTAVRARIG